MTKSKNLYWYYRVRGTWILPRARNAVCVEQGEEFHVLKTIMRVKP